jgi:hypothetical protein
MSQAQGTERRWRVIITDSELETGVAPVCPQPDVHAMMHGGTPDDPFVYDECCVGPHIECFTECAAPPIAHLLTQAEAEVCS